MRLAQVVIKYARAPERLYGSFSRFARSGFQKESNFFARDAYLFAGLEVLERELS